MRAYHGTSDKFLRSILKRGIIPTRGLRGKEHSYFTTNLETARVYALQTTYGNWVDTNEFVCGFGGRPVIIIVTIDSNRIDKNYYEDNCGRVYGSISSKDIIGVKQLRLVKSDLQYLDLVFPWGEHKCSYCKKKVIRESLSPHNIVAVKRGAPFTETLYSIKCPFAPFV